MSGGEKRFLNKALSSIEIVLIAIYSSILALFLIVFWLTVSLAVFTTTHQVSDISSDLVVVFGVLLGLTPLIKRRVPRFYSSVILVLGVLISLMARIVAETSTETTQNLARMATLLNGAFTVLIIFIAVYPVLLLIYGEEESTTPNK